jgi:uncharacterized membrane protein
MVAQLREALRVALMATSACLGMGLVMSLLVAGPARPAAIALIWIGLGLLVLVPVGNVVAVLIEEWPAKPRTFAYVAMGVIAVLVWAVMQRL